MEVTINEDGKFVIKISGLLENLDHKEKLNLARTLCWDEVLSEAASKLLGVSSFWSFDDPAHRLAFVQSVEAEILSGYTWNILSSLRDLAKNMISHEHIYWELYHNVGPIENGSQWLRNKNIESNYTHESEAFDKFQTMVKEELTKARDSIRKNIKMNVYVDEDTNRLEAFNKKELVELSKEEINYIYARIRK